MVSLHQEDEQDLTAHSADAWCPSLRLWLSERCVRFIGLMSAAAEDRGIKDLQVERFRVCNLSSCVAESF